MSRPEDSPTNPDRIEDEFELDATLRPRHFDEFVGQQKLKENLIVFVTAAKDRGEPLDHALFYGPPGLGKTTLATIIARELESDLRTTSGPALERPGDLAGILTNLKEGDVLFIDEIHRLNRVVEEYLYSAMEDFTLDIVIDKGANARTIQLNLPRFTLVGATTRAGLLTAPLRSRFGVVSRLDYYPPEDLDKIVLRSSTILDVEIVQEAALELARRSRGTPRIANRLLRRVRDFAQVAGENVIDQKITDLALDRLDVDQRGLDEMDKRILITVMEKFSGGPVGLSTLSVAVGEDRGTIEELYEPYLIQEGLLMRTPRGRAATDLAYQHFGITRAKSGSQRRLF